MCSVVFVFEQHKPLLPYPRLPQAKARCIEPGRVQVCTFSYVSRPHLAGTSNTKSQTFSSPAPRLTAALRSVRVSRLVSSKWVDEAHWFRGESWHCCRLHAWPFARVVSQFYFSP